MLFKLKVLTLAVSSALVLGSAPVWAQTQTSGATTQVAAASPSVKLATQYSELAGSTENANTLVIGLRDAQPVTLTASADGTSPSVTFTPATSKLGYGSINTALSLAQADLAKQGISNPTPAQLAAALNGGTITTVTGSVTFAGVLAQRQAGLGWGQIANAMGVRLGSVVSASKTDKASAASVKAAKTDASAKSVKAAGAEGDSSRGNSAGGQGSGGGNGGGNGGGGGNSGGGRGGK
jgi:uncharacterized membrane protein YgcG